MAALEARRRGWLDLIREVEQLASHAAAPDAADRLARLITRWGAEAAEVDAGVGQRFEAAVASTQEALERAEAERAAEARKQEAVEQALAERKALVERLESLGRDSADDQAAIASAWQALPARRSSRCARAWRRDSTPQCAGSSDRDAIRRRSPNASNG